MLTRSLSHLNHVSNDINVRGPQCYFVIKEAFSCQTSGLAYCISCCRPPATYIDETGRTPRQHFGQHLRSIEKKLPCFLVTEHINTAGHSINDALVFGIMLCGETRHGSSWRCPWFFSLAPVLRRGLNYDFHFLYVTRRAAPHYKVYLSVYFFFHGVCQPCKDSNVFATPLMKGQARNVWKGTHTTNLNHTVKPIVIFALVLLL